MGLSHFDKFLKKLKYIKNRKYPKPFYTLNEIVDALLNKEINVYDLLEDFVYYLVHAPSHLPNGTVLEGKKLAPASIQLYIRAIRSYLGYNDIDIVPSKFKNKVKIPKILRYDEEAIDASDIRNILNSCNNKRLKAYLLVLASGGMCTMEAVGIRLKDIKFNFNPTMIHIRPEFSKTRVGRDIYISDEATKYLKEWIDFKYRDRNRKDSPEIIKDDNDLIFQQVNITDVRPSHIYRTLAKDFNDILETLKMDERKEGMLRRKITLNSFRRFVYSTISTFDVAYAEWYLGHNKSHYWTFKEGVRRKVYADQCMRYFTFLDYSLLEATGKDVQLQLEQKTKEIEELKQAQKTHMKSMKEEMDLFKQELAAMKKRQKKK